MVYCMYCSVLCTETVVMRLSICQLIWLPCVTHLYIRQTLSLCVVSASASTVIPGTISTETSYAMLIIITAQMMHFLLLKTYSPVIVIVIVIERSQSYTNIDFIRSQSRSPIVCPLLPHQY